MAEQVRVGLLVDVVDQSPKLGGELGVPHRELGQAVADIANEVGIGSSAASRTRTSRRQPS